MVKCDRTWEVDAMREGRLSASDAESFRPHMRTCRVCRDRFDQDERLKALGETIEAPEPDEVALRRMRTRILKGANGPLAQRSSARWMVLAAALLSIAAVSVWWLGHARTTVPVAATESFAGTITGEGLYERTRDADVERVTLRNGRIEVRVRHLVVGERFLIALPDGELEVRGTTFEVVVDGGATQRVSVTEGWVALRLTDAAEVELRAGQSWARTPTTPPSAPATSLAPVASVAKANAASSSSDLYADAMTAYRKGDYELASNRFRAFVASAPNAPEAEDAAYLEAVSLSRAGHDDAAANVARAFLVKYPTSFHRKEASVLAARASTP